MDAHAKVEWPASSESCPHAWLCWQTRGADKLHEHHHPRELDVPQVQLGERNDGGPRKPGRVPSGSPRVSSWSSPCSTNTQALAAIMTQQDVAGGIRVQLPGAAAAQGLQANEDGPSSQGPSTTCEGSIDAHGIAQPKRRERNQAGPEPKWLRIYIIYYM